MQKQKTIAKWLAVLLLLTVAVASYIALGAVLDGKTPVNNVAGAQDQNNTDQQTPPEVELPPASDETPHIPQYSTFPREATLVNGIKALNIGGEGDDALLDCICCYGYDILVFESLSEEHDVQQTGLHLALVKDGALRSTHFISQNEEYVDCTLSAGGLLVVTRDSSQTILRLVDRDMNVTLKAATQRYEDYKLFTSDGALKLYVTEKDRLGVCTVSRTLSVAKSNRSAQIEGANIACVMPCGTADLIFLQTENGIAIYTYSANNGFNCQNELLNCAFVQILPIKTESKQTFALLASSDDGYTVYGLSESGEDFAKVPVEGARSAALLKTGTNVTVVSDKSVLTLCSHLELTATAPVKTENKNVFATSFGTLYCIDEDGLTLLDFDGESLLPSLALKGAFNARIISKDGGISIAYSAEESDFADMSFGGSDIYFVIDIEK